jgi:hypothetical protein
LYSFQAEFVVFDWVQELVYANTINQNDGLIQHPYLYCRSRSRAHWYRDGAIVESLFNSSAISFLLYSDFGTTRRKKWSSELTPTPTVM